MIGTKHIITILFFVMLSTIAYSQASEIVHSSSEDNDISARTGFAFSKEITPTITIFAGEELRMKSNISEIDKSQTAIGASYGFCKYFKVNATYTFIATNYDNNWIFSNRGELDLIASYKINKNWQLSFRERLRVTSLNKNIDPLTSVNPECVLRSRLKASYIPNNSPITPFIYFEISYTIKSPEIISNYINKLRSSVGVEYTITERSALEFYYRFDVNTAKEISYTSTQDIWDILSNRKYNNIVGLFYTYSF